ncbi:hypothetical protein AVEN_169685-1 [Araneus ventricosus]|uniref:Uncharacterized protein n=1 Tax=Araneus ventricosus TaxID=182803 RepID=A0A4Y2D354_ARAVE|nr:hypothetical protein AVEN_169685-1 [Araneus ventricosus]
MASLASWNMDFLQLVRAAELIHDGFTKSETTGALFLYVSKAFDKIWQDGLLFKLMRLGVSPQHIKIFRSYLTSRNFQVRVNHIISSLAQSLAAMPTLININVYQLSTFLNIYVSDIPNSNDCRLVIFAHDIAIPSHIILYIIKFAKVILYNIFPNIETV